MHALRTQPLARSVRSAAYGPLFPLPAATF